MPRKPKFNPAIHDENPDWTEEDFAKARPASEMHADMLAQFKNGRGRPKLEHPKQAVKLRIDAHVLSALRASGPGWQTNVNDLLRSRIKDGKFIMITKAENKITGKPKATIMRTASKKKATPAIKRG